MSAVVNLAPPAGGRPRLLAISGSLRAESYTTAVLRTLKETLAPAVEVIIHPLGDLPLYNQDLDTPEAPAAVAALRRAIGEADGVILATPEFNYGLPGVLKNALDWASRPYAQSTLTGKPALTLSASPAFTGGVRAQAQLNETLLAIGARLLARPQTVIGSVHEKIADGRLADRTTLTFVLAGVEDLLREIGVSAAVELQAAE